MNPITRQAMDHMRYGELVQLCPDEHPVGNNPLDDYMLDEIIAPVTISDHAGTRYTTHYMHRMALRDIHDATCMKQGMTMKKVFPRTIKIDADVDNGNYWIAILYNLVGFDSIARLPQPPPQG